MDYSLQEHFKHYDEDASKHMGEVLRIFTDKILNKAAGLTTKSRILAVLLQRRDAERFKKLHSVLDLPEVVRACEILDAGRLQRQIEKKIAAHPTSSKLNKKKILAEELKEGNKNMSLSLSKIKIVKEWVKNLPKDKIEYRAMLFAPDLWRKLADLCHLNPKTDFADECEWFLPFCFGKPVEPGNIVYDYHHMTYGNFYESYEKHGFSYELIRAKLKLDQASVSRLSSSDRAWVKNIKISIVNREKINTVLWYWDELVEEYNVMDVVNRIKESDGQIDLSYGKIVDVISKTSNKEVLKELLKIGEERMTRYQINLAQPVAVFGDESGSMEVAIKTSGIITSLLCCLCNASLHLFHSVDEHFPDPPRTITDAVKFGKEVKTKGSTAPASSLMHYYKQKKRLATIILITDEEENESCEGQRFSGLFLRYLQDVCVNAPLTKLVFISFSDPNKDGAMVQSLRQMLVGRRINNCLIDDKKFDEIVKVFKFNVSDPDLNRMDIVLKYLSENN